MWRREVTLSTFSFGLLFFLQEGVINQFHLPFGGFSLLLLAALIWSSISEPEIAAVTGFVAGLFMDMSPLVDGPFGQWTLVLVISCYSISYLGYGHDALNSNPIGLICLISTAVIATLLLYILIGLLFGITFGSPFNLFKTLIGFGLWSALIAPLLTPLISNAHEIVYSGNR
jgi:rod shape-determining protein MreD